MPIAGQIVVAEESSYGTYVAGTRAIEFTDESLEFDRETIWSEGIRAGRRVQSRYAQGVQRVTGDITMELAPQGTGILFKQIFGGIATTGAGPYCVDEETEILTVEGWRRYDQIKPGTVVRTLNHETGLAEWQPVDSVHVFPAERRELVRMITRDHSSLTTPNHRWPVESFRYRTGEFKRIWKTSETLAAADRLIKAAQPADQPVEQKWSDDLVELVAWFYTEGTVTKSGTVRICQSHQVNQDMCDRIAGVLRRMFGEPSESMAYEHRTDHPRWRVHVEDRNMRFRLNKAASDLLHAVCPDKVPSFDWMRELTVAQLHLFLNVSLMADGDGTPAQIRTPRLAQTDRRRAEAFQFAAIMAGYGTSMRWRDSQRETEGQHVVSTHRGTRTCVMQAARQPGVTASYERVMHDGLVWCPKTPNSSWLARRDGAVYFTGNTHTFTPGTLTGKSLSIQVGRPFLSGTVQPFSILGAKITEAEIAAEVNEYATLTMSVYGNHEDTGQTLAVAAYPATLTPFVFTHGSLSVAGSGVDVRSFTLNIDNALIIDRHFIRTTTPERAKEPLEGGYRQITGSFEADFESLTAYNRYVQGTQAALVLTFNAGASAQLTITMNVMFDGATPTISSPDELVAQTMEYKAVSSTSDAAAITAVLVNGDSAP